MTNTKALVLGGAGYIGSHTLYELIDNGAEVVVIDNLETGFASAVHPSAKQILGWKPEHNSLEEIIRSAWNWHRMHPDGYKNR